MLIVRDVETGDVVAVRGRANLHLEGKDRLYVFEFGPGFVGVRKWLGTRKVEDRTLSVPKARVLWAWLVKIGYVRV